MRHIATYIGFNQRLEIHDETEWLAYPQYGCPDTYDGEPDGEGGMSYSGFVDSDINELIWRLDDHFAEHVERDE